MEAIPIMRVGDGNLTPVISVKQLGAILPRDLVWTDHTRAVFGKGQKIHFSTKWTEQTRHHVICSTEYASVKSSAVD